MAESEVSISYQTLFELLRRETNREDLQLLDKDFFKNVVNYVKEKRSYLQSQKKKEDLFAEEEGKKAEVEFESIKKLIRKLYDKRESKILTMAIDSSRTDSSIIDTSSMLPEEKELYHKLLHGLDDFRKGILIKLLEGNEPLIKLKANDAAIETAQKVQQQQQQQPNLQEEQQEAAATLSAASPEDNLPSQEDALAMIRVKFKEEMPQFMGEDFNQYGPFIVGDVSELPPGITDILLDKNVVEKA